MSMLAMTWKDYVLKMKAKFVISKDIVLKQFNIVNELVDYVSYSSKTNPLITKILEENTGSMFSIHLINELKNVKDKSRVLFLAQAWNNDVINELIKQGIKWFVVDNENDLNCLLNYLDVNDVKINLLLRLRLKENTIRTEKYFVFGFKAEFISDKIKELRDNKNIELLGIHFHRKTQNMAECNLKHELENTFDEEFFNKIDLINIGGGLPSEYANTNVDVINNVMIKIKEVKDFLSKYKVKLMLEPGRFIAAPSGKLIAEIISVYDNNIIVNASVYNSDLDALIVPVKLKIENEGNGKPYVVKGLTPCSVDLFRYRVYLENPKIGDQITFLNAGAYNFSSDFCELDKLETEIV